MKSGFLERQFHPELMDQPELDASEHFRALGGLRRLNQASGVSRQLWRLVAKYCSIERRSPLRVLDVASGGGDVALGLWKLARRRGVHLEILGLDVSAAACQYARLRCKAAGESIAFQQADAVSESLPQGFDVVTCSLFLHHLTVVQVPCLLHKMATAARLLVVSDLRRCVTGYALAKLACRILTRSPIVRADGPQSVANAFSLQEMQGLCAAAGLADAEIRAAWPYRLLVIRKRN